MMVIVCWKYLRSENRMFFSISPGKKIAVAAYQSLNQYTPQETGNDKTNHCSQLDRTAHKACLNLQSIS